MVPMLTCGLVRSNFAFATGVLLGLERVTPYDVLSVLSGAPGASSRSCSGLLAAGLLDDLFRHVARNLGVGVELHAVARPALGLAPEVSDVAEHLRQGYECVHDPRTGPLLHGLDLATAGVQVADDLTHVVLGRGHLDGHHRLE